MVKPRIRIVKGSRWADRRFRSGYAGNEQWECKLPHAGPIGRGGHPQLAFMDWQHRLMQNIYAPLRKEIYA